MDDEQVTTEIYDHQNTNSQMVISQLPAHPGILLLEFELPLTPLRTYRTTLAWFEMLQDFFCLVCSLERKKKNNNNFSRLLMWTMKRSAVNALQEKLSEESVSLSTLERFIASPLSLWCMTGIFFKLHFWVCWLYSWAHFSHFNIPDGRVACWWEAPKKTRGK